ncbi:hypothetical protein J2855_001719 [Agrobacterium tumefaciens]|jgi:hypothetical protein|uniref:hypothetical protein n=1 Tax=Rhizobium/Agrobacterium group TaxID=227290 RepID=UPI0007156ABB|nr:MULTISPECIES: hypothetical protein [Rhizobium/Agrobacterium group]KQY53095.1 hypothetical protein ASD46_01185 [Rhizobium sp. Root491]MBP2508084.1 hypothetical protein [Agrobacterium tumefaciens]MBP2517236.1 hypothetical protein [Agrobacterium tumefaciens]MBP2575870.1 hypothetical protein [Agrobacterium tumefaciens]MBP2594226.1 hypothetical protein [Agrobacterium tumefaciens]
MNMGHLALLYLGIAVLAVGCATFVGGLVYLIWLIFSEPAIIRNEIGARALMYVYDNLPLRR